MVSARGTAGNPEARVRSPDAPDLIRKTEEVEASTRGAEYFGSVFPEKESERTFPRISTREKYQASVGTRFGKSPPVSEYKRKSSGDADPDNASE